MTELDGIAALLVFVAAAVLWVAFEVKRLHDTLQPILESRIAQTLASV